MFSIAWSIHTDPARSFVHSFPFIHSLSLVTPLSLVQLSLLCALLFKLYTQSYLIVLRLYFPFIRIDSHSKSSIVYSLTVVSGRLLSSLSPPSRISFVLFSSPLRLLPSISSSCLVCLFPRLRLRLMVPPLLLLRTMLHGIV